MITQPDNSGAVRAADCVLYVERMRVLRRRGPRIFNSLSALHMRVGNRGFFSMYSPWSNLKSPILPVFELTLLSLFVASAAFSQSPNAPTTGSPTLQPAEAAQLQAEVVALRDQMQTLEQRMKASAPAKMQAGGTCKGCGSAQSGSMQSKRPSMEMSTMMEGMGMASRSASNDASTSVANGAMAMEQMMGTGATGGMKSTAAAATPSALPGFPGQSHLYHIGATDFFLDHLQHSALTTQQLQLLAQQKQRSLLQQSDLQHQIDAAEERLWQLTGADQPELVNIDKQVREIERLRAEQRIAFIRAVGEAAKALTDQQRQQLTGMRPAESWVRNR